MTPLDPNTGGKTRVSILERLVPSLGLALAAIAGAVGGAMTLQFLDSLRNVETAGYEAFYAGTTRSEFVVGVILVFAAGVTAIGVLVSVIRIFTDNKKASPSGVLLLVLALLAAVPPFLVHYAVHAMKHAVAEPAQGGIASVVELVTTLLYVAIGGGTLVVVILLVFAFVPMSSRLGRKASPSVGSAIAAIMIGVLAGIFFWEARNSVLERSGRTHDFDDPPPATPGKEYTESPPANAVEYVDTNTAPSGPSKMVSGGLLNSKAVTMPEPEYPAVVRAVRASGPVNVQVLVSETGQVISATAVSGHPLLHGAAEGAARKARFTPMLLGGRPVKVTGVLTYEFNP